MFDPLDWLKMRKAHGASPAPATTGSGAGKEPAQVAPVSAIAVESLEIIQDIIPQGRKNRPGTPMRPGYVTVHDTDNQSRGADALAHSRYVLSEGEAGRVSWHYTVDDRRIVQHLPLNETAYHAGDGGNGPGNTTSIGIEICENADGDRRVAENHAIRLIAALLTKLQIPLSNVKPHKHWSGKQCPHLILPRWEQFVNQISEQMLAIKR